MEVKRILAMTSEIHAARWLGTEKEMTHTVFPATQPAVETATNFYNYLKPVR